MDLGRRALVFLGDIRFPGIVAKAEDRLDELDCDCSIYRVDRPAPRSPRSRLVSCGTGYASPSAASKTPDPRGMGGVDGEPQCSQMRYGCSPSGFGASIEIAAHPS